MTFTKTYTFSFFYLIAGVTSTYIFHQGDENIIPNGLYPGLIFIAVTIICSLFVTKLTLIKIISFIALTYLTYLIIFCVTLFSYYYALFFGIVTGGLGSLVTFNLFDIFIKPISYNNKIVFGLGTIAFALNAVIVYTPLREIAPSFYRRDIVGNFSAIFFLWQFIVGTKLSQALAADS
jgi:hypothetical protein